MRADQFRLVFLTLVIWLLTLDPGQAESNTGSNSTSQRLLKRVRRNKFVKTFMEKSKASQDKVRELESMYNKRNWPVIAWKADSDVFNIGDDGQMESSPFEALSEEDTKLVTHDLNDFSLKPASTYKAQLDSVQSRILIYNQAFVFACILLFGSNILLVFVRYWLIGLSRLILRAGLKIEFQATRGPKRQEFIYSMAFIIQEDLLDNPANKAEHGFAACINDAVVAVESYTQSRA